MKQKESRQLSRGKKAVFIGVTVFFVLLFAEFATRLLIKLNKKTVDSYRKDYYNVLKYDPSKEWGLGKKNVDLGIFTGHPYLPFILKPNIKHTWVAKFPMLAKPIAIHIESNSFGLRGPEIPLRPKPGTFRILCLGGSTTFGVVDDKDTWPRQLEKMLHDAHPELKVEVANAGVPGYTSAESLVNFALRWLELKPDAVIVHHMINDLAMAGFEPFYADYSHIRKDIPSEPVWIDYFPSFFEKSAIFCLIRWELFPSRRNDINVLIFEKKPGVKKGFSEYGKLTLVRNVHSIISLAKANNIFPVIATMNFLRDSSRPGAFKDEQSIKRMEEYNEALIELGRKEGVPVVDNYGLIGNEESLYADGVHMTVEGEKKKAANAFDVFEREGWLDLGSRR